MVPPFSAPWQEQGRSEFTVQRRSFTKNHVQVKAYTARKNMKTTMTYSSQRIG